MIAWFINDGSPFLSSVEDPSMVLIGRPVPEVVRMPEESPLDPGRVLRVLGATTGACPRCGAEPVRLVLLEDRYLYAECGGESCGFVICRLPAETAS